MASKKHNEVVIDVDERNELGHPLDYRELNEKIRGCISSGMEKVILKGVTGQRYIASAMDDPDVKIDIHGTPGNDLGAFLNGGTIEVFGNAQDVTGNTMNDGRIIVHGNSWDITGLAARGGTILIRGNSGYRVGIHMKEFNGSGPRLVIGGSVHDYLGEYMAGGTIAILGIGMEEDVSPVGLSVGTGMHGGRIFVRGAVEEHQLGTAAHVLPLTDEDWEELQSMIEEFEHAFGLKPSRCRDDYVKVGPLDSRPFRGHYDKTNI
ncbi:MAG: hypothetical protein PHW93_04390 [Candidatus Methanomethylophilaceae archaeon]|nr:hypothetical protein [Candidatus Methanomethylophilaceae archaeon]